MNQEIVECEQCGAKRKSNVYHNKRWLCRKHYDQLRKFGYFLDNVSINKMDSNEFEVKDDIVFITLRNKNNQEVGKAIIDRDDFELCKPHKWYMDSAGYVRTTIEGKKIRLHKLITDTSSDVMIDHINRNKLDCRKSNLRECSYSLNSLNRKRQRNNTSKNTGVSYHVVYEPTNLGYWYARYNNQDLGIAFAIPFKRKSDAIKQRDEWVKRYGGVSNE